MAKLSFEDACFQWASNMYLFEEVPDEYFEWSEPNQHEHLEQYAWAPLEHYDGYKLSNLIDTKVILDRILSIIFTDRFKNTLYLLSWSKLPATLFEKLNSDFDLTFSN